MEMQLSVPVQLGTTASSLFRNNFIQSTHHLWVSSKTWSKKEHLSDGFTNSCWISILFPGQTLQVCSFQHPSLAFTAWLFFMSFWAPWNLRQLKSHVVCNVQNIGKFLGQSLMEVITTFNIFPVMYLLLTRPWKLSSISQRICGRHVITSKTPWKGFWRPFSFHNVMKRFFIDPVYINQTLEGARVDRQKSQWVVMVLLISSVTSNCDSYSFLNIRSKLNSTISIYVKT